MYYTRCCFYNEKIEKSRWNTINASSMWNDTIDWKKKEWYPKNVKLGYRWHFLVEYKADKGDNTVQWKRMVRLVEEYQPTYLNVQFPSVV